MHPLDLNLLVKARILELHQEAARNGRVRLIPHADDRPLGRRARRALGGALILLGQRLHGEHRRPGFIGDGGRPAA